ncbi:O-antigen ligase family protein [Vibrio rarus]|uniref:O-antigen ligase family protein n=1 Tax=Vibrio rarus TaxID=413403 RepID=UPI0021C2BDE6|nr:hypothetical protein [Vibrio rarus]
MTLSRKNNPPVVSSLILLVIAIFSFNLYLLPDKPVLLYDTKRLFVCALVIGVCLSLIFWAELRIRLVQRYMSASIGVRTLVATFFVLALIADLFGLYPNKGVVHYFYFIGLLFFTLCFSLERPSLKSFKLFGLIILCGFFSVFIGYSVATFWGDGATIRTILSYANPRFLNQVQVWLVIPSLYMVLVSKSRISYLFPVLNFAVMFALDARGLAVASIGGIILWALIDRKNRHEIIKIALFTLTIGLLISVIFLSPLPTYIMHGEGSRSLLDLRDNTANRWSLWYYGIEMSRFFGLGGDGYVCTSTQEIRPHNSVIYVLLNWGVIPALCYMALGLILFKQVIQEKRYRYRVIGLSLLTGLAYSLVSSVLDSPLSLLLACLFTGWFCGRTPLVKPVDYPRWVTGLLIIASLLSVLSVIYKASQRIKNDFYIHNEESVLRPQFWLGNNCPHHD